MEVGAGYVTIYPDTSSFHNALASAVDGTLNDRTGQQAANSFFSPWQVAIGNLLADMGRNLIGSVGERMSEAIGRLDTLTNYPKVMEGFGYSAQEAEDSIELIMDRLVGLPTKTQEMVQFTQSLADSTNDLDLATRGALAFNDALLASGASTVDQTRAQRIFNRIVGSGTATVNQWSALMSVMPLQLGMTSRAMLGAEASTEDLGIALREGKVSIEDILRTMVRLDTEGAEGMDSFNEQAWNMAFTLETALGLIPTRMSNALAAIMGEIGRDNIMAPFLGIANGIKDAGDAIVYAIQWVKHMFADDLHEIYLNLKSIGDSMGEFFGVLGGTIISAIKAATPVILSFLDVMTKVIADVFQWVADHGEAVQAVLVGIATTMLAFKALSFLNTIPILFSTAALSATRFFGIIAANPLVALVSVIAGVVAALATWIATTDEGRAAWESFCAAAAPILTAAVDIIQTTLQGAVAFFVGFGESIITTLHGVREFFVGIVDSIITTLHGVREFFVGLGESIMTTLHGVREFIVGIVDSIITTVHGFQDFSEVVMGALYWINDLITTFWADVLLIFTSLGGLLLEAFGGIGQLVEKVWKDLVSGAKKWWNNLKKEAKKAWDGIVKTITGIVGGLVSAVTGFFGGIASTASGIWNSMKSAASSAWNSMKSAASSAWNGIKSAASSIWGGIKSTIGGLVDGVKTAAGNAWNNMKSAASSAWNSMKSSASTVFNNIKSTIGNALDGARNLARSALDGIQGFINNLTGKTVNVTVKDGTPGGTASLVDNINNQIKKARGTTVDINVRKTGINGIQLTPSYSGGRVTSMWATTMAKGGTITSPTIALIGEAGYNETVIPNTPWGVRPLAQAVAAEVSQSKGGVLITGNTFNVRNDRDIESVANRLNDMISRQMGGRL